MTGPGRSIPIVISTPALPHRDRQCEPVTMGVPFPIGLVADTGDLALEADDASPVPLQVQATERWSDGSVRWALLDFQVAGRALAERRFSLHIGTGSKRPSAPPLLIDETARQVAIDTGVAQFVVRAGAAFPFARVLSDGLEVLDTSASGLIVTTPSGRSLPARITRVTVEERGPLRTTVRLDGSIGPAQRPPLHLTARLQFFAGSSAVRLAVTVLNPRRARHRGGIWELGDAGSVCLRDLSLRLVLPATITRLECATETAVPMAAVDLPAEIYQDSSGGANWRHIAHVDRYGAIPCTFRGYRAESGARRVDGLRATPVMIAHATGPVGVAVEHFWQNWPKALAADADTLTFRMFPGQCANEHELQGGEQKTHRCTLMFGTDPSAHDARFWGRAPALAYATPDWHCSAAAVAHLTVCGSDPYQQLVDAAIDGEDSIEQKRELADEYGWRHFGDIYADHENGFSGRAEPVVSHYNNQYDAIAGFAYQFMRSGNRRWHRLMAELAAHVVDIDIYHTDADKSAYNHGLFWHTSHYVTAGLSTHRSFPKDPKVHGGGPSNEHNYTAGLRLHWLLTGDPQSRDAAIELATWVITMDDGERTLLRWLSPTSTGLASQTYAPTFHGPGRGAGHSILALLDGHRITADDRFMAKAEQLVRRCIHPSDDIDAHDLLDAERRWSYTVFLQALGKYLDYRVELNRIDDAYAYGRAALLHYARWMAAHESPYLERPEILEYPTETWAAQDMRKCEVFLFAAGHCVGDERQHFIERAAAFHHYSVSTLLESKTRTLARPMVLMLTNGFLHLAPGAAAPRPEPVAIAEAGFGRPTVFVPQKMLAKQRLTTSAGAAVLVVVTLALLAFA